LIDSLANSFTRCRSTGCHDDTLRDDWYGWMSFVTLFGMQFLPWNPQLNWKMFTSTYSSTSYQVLRGILTITNFFVQLFGQFFEWESWRAQSCLSALSKLWQIQYRKYRFDHGSDFRLFRHHELLMNFIIVTM